MRNLITPKQFLVLTCVVTTLSLGYFTVVREVLTDTSSPSVSSPAREERAQLGEEGLGQSEQFRRTPIDSVSSGPLPPEVPLNAEEIRAIVEELATLNLQREGAAIEALMQRLLLDPAGIEQVLALLHGGQLSSSTSELSAAERGAIIAVALATAVLNAPAGAGNLSNLPPRDGKKFMVSVLETLPSMNPMAQTLLASLLSSATVDGQMALNETFLATVIRLRAIHPDSRELFNGLLQNMGASLGAEERESFYRLLLSDVDDPTVVKVALAALFEGEHPELYLGVAQGMFGGASDTMRQEIANAVANSAPPTLAAEFLAEHASAKLYAQFATLGQREGAVEALVDQYNQLVATNASPDARVMIISALPGIGEESLLGFAQTDPAPTVRGQALVTAGNAFPTENTLTVLRTAWSNRSDPYLGIPAYQAISTAYNIGLKARRSGKADLHTGACNMLREIVLDRSVSTNDRRTALGKLGKFLSTEELASLEASIP